jgi:hypothetical protein
MALYRRREVTAQMIYDFLALNGPSSWVVIQRGTGLTDCQIGYGFGFLKDVLQTHNGQPLIWSPRRGVYDLTSVEAEWMEYLVEWRLKSVATQLRRIEATAIAGGMKFGKQKKATRVALAGISAARQMVDALV